METSGRSCNVRLSPLAPEFRAPEVYDIADHQYYVLITTVFQARECTVLNTTASGFCFSMRIRPFNLFTKFLYPLTAAFFDAIVIGRFGISSVVGYLNGTNPFDRQGK